MDKRVVDAEAAQPPTTKSRKGNDLKMGGPQTRASPRNNETSFQVRILVASRRLASFDGFYTIRHLPGKNPTGSNHCLITYPWLNGAKNLEVRPRIQVAYSGRSRILALQLLIFRGQFLSQDPIALTCRHRRGGHINGSSE